MKFIRTSFCLLLILLFLASFTVPAHAQIPFGGAITGMYPVCQAGPGQVIGTAIQLSPPTPIAVMYIFSASQSFPLGPPAHPGQWLLGMVGGFAPCIIWIPCGITICPIPNPALPGGSVILFHGSSA